MKIDLTDVRAATAIEEVEIEREKQRARWGDDHDDSHEKGELAAAAALLASSPPDMVDAPEWAEPIRAKYCENRRRQLIIAAALLVAEIERIDRGWE